MARYVASPLSSLGTWKDGNPQKFLYASVRVLRDLARHLEDAQERQEVNNARRMLEAPHDSRTIGKKLIIGDYSGRKPAARPNTGRASGKIYSSGYV